MSSEGREGKEMYAVLPGSFLRACAPLRANNLTPSTVYGGSEQKTSKELKLLPGRSSRKS